ncbi:hypothetical protein ABKN59_005965, partial [Abortiporus biennis]
MLPSSIFYKPLATDEDEDIFLDKEQRRRRVKKVIFHLLAVVGMMYATFVGTKALFRWSAVSPATRKPCHNRNLTSLPTHYTLPSGDKIPSVALGVWQAGRGEVGAAVTTALRAGYRHIDGAWIYGNEVEVGQAIKSSGIARDELWITSKLWNTFHAPEDVEPALDETLSRLDTEYIDLYLIHWPIAFKKGSNNVVDEQLTANPYPTWKKLEE